MINMKKINCLLLSFIFLLLLIPSNVFAEPEEYLSNPNLGFMDIYGRGKQVGENEYLQATYSRFKVRGEKCELTNLVGHDAVCGKGGLHFKANDRYNAVECNSELCKTLGKYWYAARKAANCSNDDYACLQKLAGIDEKYGGKRYYYAIRDLSRSGSCTHDLCGEIEKNIEEGKSCKIYEAHPYYFHKESQMYKIANRQPMYIADCDDITIEENNCKDVEGCCVDESKTPAVYYIDGKVVEDKKVFLDQCACTQQPEYKYWFLPDGKTADSEQEFIYYCDCNVDDSTTPLTYYVLDSNKTKQDVVSFDEYKDKCKCRTFDLDGKPTIYYGPNPPTTVGSESDQIAQCKSENVCKHENGIYYGKDGTEVTEEEFKKDCSCVKLEIDGSIRYYGPIPPNPPDNILQTEDEWNEQCKNKCKKVGNTYYGVDGKPVDSEEAYKKSCGCRKEEDSNGNTIYYGPSAEVLESKEDFEEKCESKNLCKYENGTYYGPDGTPLESEEAYRDKCKCRIETDGSGNTIYYGLDPFTVILKQQYDEECSNVGEHKCELFGGKYYGPAGEVLSGSDEWNEKCCGTKYEDCCVINNKYYIDGVKVDKAKCSKCKPFVSYHNTCENPEETEEISFSDGEQVGDLTKTSNEDKESVNYLTYKEIEDNNIVKCVLEKKEDYAGNSLETKIVYGNNYCKVLCKEDFGKFDKDGNLLEDQKYKYGYSVAGMQDANSGRYFKLSAAYNAKKTCYSSSAEDNNRREIDLDLFNEQVNKEIEIINDNINKMNLAYVRLQYLQKNRPASVYNPENEKNPDECTQAKTYSIETITYEVEGPVKPIEYKIRIDKDKTTDYHISYIVEEGKPLDSTVQKYFETETATEQSAQSSGFHYEYNPATKKKDILVYDYENCIVERKTATEQLNELISEYQTEYDSAKTAIDTAFKNINNYIDQINRCTSWYNDMKYNTEPDINFKYGYQDDESKNYDYGYFDMIKDPSIDAVPLVRGEKEEISNIDGADDWSSSATDTTLKATKIDKSKIKKELSGSTIKYDDERSNTDPCVNDEYSGNRNNGCVTASLQEESVNYVKMNLGSGYYVLESDPQDMSNKTFTKKNIEVHYEYASPNLFATLYPSGVVVLRSDSNFEDNENQRMKVDFGDLPVQLETESGLHKFTFTFSDIGEYFDHEGEGRVLNAKNHKDENTVLGKYNSAEKPIFNDDSEYEYLCYYRVNQGNCPTCIPGCDEDGCETTVEECKGENCCPVCDIECVDCIYSKKEFHLDVTPIPLRVPQGNPNDPNEVISVVSPPGSEYVPYNWNAWSVSEEYGDRYKIISDKAKLTINEIQTYGELIYVSKELGTDDVYEGQPSIEGISSPTDFGVLKVVMTPSLAQKIRNYNDDKSFTDQTLMCYDYTYDTYKFEKIFCYSSFLDEYRDNPNFTFYSGRLSDDNSRSTTNNQNGYWQTFIDQPDCGGSSCGQYAEKINKIVEGEMSQIGGPSWR